MGYVIKVLIACIAIQAGFARKCSSTTITNCGPGGQSNTLGTPRSAPSLLSSANRIAKALKYIRDKVETLKSTYRRKISDSDMLDILDNARMLIGFPSSTFVSKDNVTDMLLSDYSHVTTVKIFVEIMLGHEQNGRLKRKIERIISRLRNILCELEVVINNPMSLPDIPVVNTYRNLSRTDFTNWGYVLLRDLHVFTLNGIRHYTSLSSRS